MIMKTKRMTAKYWNSLSEGTKQRALTYVFPMQSFVVELLLKQKPNNTHPSWKIVFDNVRIPDDTSFYKAVVNGTYMS